MKRTLVLVALSTILLARSLGAQIDADLLAGMKARSIGPATMSGRIADIDAVASDPNIVYVGVATGGVWKSTDGAMTWAPVFDDEPVAAIGAVAVNQQNPDVVWVGTGESNVRNSASVGNGVYRSVDGGVSWKHVGLDGTERISRIRLHPTDPDTAWVAAMGRAWGENAERGVFRTTDGGKSWTKVLYVDPRSGAADLAIDPSNPNKLFAATWDYRRWPWFFRSGGPGSGLWVSHDGGTSWKRLTEDDGLPKGNLGRIGVAFAPSSPSIVYALVEAEKSALLRSDDGGTSWKTMNDDPDVASRPFYYADIRVDPADPNRVYSLATLVRVSEDAGRTFRTLVPFNKIHPDHHAMWINPRDPGHLIDGNDGGVAISRDRGESWRYVTNLPLAQYYHINVDMSVPFNVYGGMQDNGSWRGPSAVWENGGIRNHHWREVGFGDGFATLAVDPEGTTGYAMSQQGFLMRWSLETGQRKDIRPAGPAGVPLRFNWNAAIAIDPLDPDTVYYGSQFVHRSADRGENWTIISPDLTTNNPAWQNQGKSGGLTFDVTGAENFTTIMTIAPSAIGHGVIWAGTDDGRIHVTRDGGSSWTSVERNVRGVPGNTWVPHIEPSKFDAATAFVVFDDHRRSNWTPYVYRTTDFGRTWTSLATSEVRGYALAIEQDPVDPNLLYLGTEFGLFVSIDGGAQWLPWRHGFPTASAMALVVHPRDHDLVVGTHGRSAFILDDVRPLRDLTPGILARDIHLFSIPDAQQYRVAQTGGVRFAGDTEFRGENRPYGALITFVLSGEELPHPIEEKERARKEELREAERAPLDVTSEGIPQETETLPKGPEEAKEEPAAEMAERDGGPKAEIVIGDAAGSTIRTFEVPVARGINRATWNLRRDAFRQPPRERTPGMPEPSGPEVLPGTYEVTLRYGDREAKGSVRVLPDPRFSIAEDARARNWETQLRIGELQEKTAEAITRIIRTRGDIDAVSAKLSAASESKDGDRGAEPDPLVKEGADLSRQLSAIERMLWVPPRTKGIVDTSQVAWTRLGRAASSIASSWDAPTAAQMAYLAEAEAILAKGIAELDRFFAEQMPPYRERVRASGVVLLEEYPPLSE
ncbi:MAG TPA: hypothetical protein VMS56_10700 [Thermoanaerobaculia bacterium]|nr:hypothetical protein [Thermoanaerobaculia bacterium]